jgi:hypothetical protein
MRPTALRRVLLGLVSALVSAAGSAGILQAQSQSTPPAAALEVVNRAPVPITDVRLASRAMSDWGPNLLATAVSAGERRKIVPSRTQGCLHAIRVTYQDGRYELFEMMDLCSNQEFMFAAKTALAVGGQGNFNAPPAAKVTFVNGSPKILSIIRMSPANSRAWGVDRLGELTLAAGQSHSVELDRNGGCQYRVRAVYEDSMNEFMRAIDLCEEHNFVFKRTTTYTNDQLPADMRFDVATMITVTNQSGMQIDYVFVFKANDSDPGPDRLGNNVVIPNGRQMRVSVTDQRQCYVTVVGVYRDQREERFRSFDLCSAPEPSVTMRGPTGMWPYARRP